MFGLDWIGRNLLRTYTLYVLYFELANSPNNIVNFTIKVEKTELAARYFI